MLLNPLISRRGALGWVAFKDSGNCCVAFGQRLQIAQGGAEQNLMFGQNAPALNEAYTLNGIKDVLSV